MKYPILLPSIVQKRKLTLLVCDCKIVNVGRLESADDALWNNTISKVNHQEIDLISQHCRAQVCHGSLSCANICLEHFLEVARDSER